MKRGDGVEPDVLLLDEVEQAAGRGDEDVDAGFHRGDLRVLVDAAEDERMAQAQVLAIGPEALIDLDRELARRRQDQRLRAARAGVALADGELVQQRQAEGRRLAGAGLGDAEQILAFEKTRDGLELDRRGIEIFLGFEHAQKRLGKAEGVKRSGIHKKSFQRPRARAANGPRAQKRRFAVFHAHLELTEGFKKSRGDSAKNRSGASCDHVG